jgi:hypothetical protein
MATQIQLRRDTAANWTANNPILAEGEKGIETNGLGTSTVLSKIGNGVDDWVTLPYQSTGGSGVSNVYDSNTITFINTTGDYFGRYATPRTGEILVDETGAVTGGISVVYYINSTLDIPFTPIATVGDFINNQLCKLYIERDVNNNYTLNIVNL